MSDFLNMGGYAAYVWSSFGFAAAVFLWNLFAPILRRSDILKELSND